MNVSSPSSMHLSYICVLLFCVSLSAPKAVEAVDSRTSVSSDLQGPVPASLASRDDDSSQVGHLARGPFSDERPVVYSVESGRLKVAPTSSPISEMLNEITSRFGVRISQKSIAGFIFDSTLVGDNRIGVKGFDVYAVADEWPLRAWFHDPFPDQPESNEYTRELWQHATGEKVQSELALGIDTAIALLHLDHAFFPAHKLGRSYYFDTRTRKITGNALEAVLHEALHVWHGRHFQKVKALLKTKGSYFDRVQKSEAICPGFEKVNVFGERPACGFITGFEAMKKVLRQVKWPQRYGQSTRRTRAREEATEVCNDSERLIQVGQQRLCENRNEFAQLGDLHALQNEFEYFAILMQLYVFSPTDFHRVATRAESQFAQKMFQSDFGLGASEKRIELERERRWKRAER